MGGRKYKKEIIWKVCCVACNRRIDTGESPRVIRCKLCDAVMSWTRLKPEKLKLKVRKVVRCTHAEYEDYLNSPAWKKVRAAKFKESGRICKDCGSTSYLTVHHRTYDRLRYEQIGRAHV